VSDRADELRRQRDLLRGHLAWLEREISAEEGRSFTPDPGVPPPLRPPEPAYTRTPVDDRDAEAILAEYRSTQVSAASQTKFGCIAYFAVAMALLIAGLMAFYYHTKAARGH
jgi:hypothetical protein